MILGLFAIIVGLSREGLAMIVSPKTPMFASRSRFLCKPLHIGVTQKLQTLMTFLIEHMKQEYSLLRN